MTTAVFLLASAPWIALLVILGIRAPAVLVAAYAAVLPFGSSISLPVGLPSPFNTSTTVLGLVTTAGLAAHVIVTGRRARQVQGPLPWWLMFFAVLLLTYAWSWKPERTLRELFVLASLLGLFALACILDVRRHEVEIVEVGISISGALTGLYALALLATGNMHVAGDGIPRFQTAGGGGEGGDPNITAAALILPLAVSLSCGMRVERRGLQRVGFLTAAGLSGLAITLTGSRGGLLATLVAVVVLASHDRRRGALAIYLGVPLLVVAVTYMGSSEELQNRLESQSTSGRDMIWSIGTQACADHCWRGTGWATFSEVYGEYYLDEAEASRTRTSVNAHSIFLQVPVEGGVLAMGAMLAAFGVTAGRLWRVIPTRRAAPLASFLGLLVTNSVLGNLAFKYFWMVLIYAAWVDAAFGPQWVGEGHEDASKPHSLAT